MPSFTHIISVITAKYQFSAFKLNYVYQVCNIYGPCVYPVWVVLWSMRVSRVGGAMVHACIPCVWCYGPCVYPVWVVLWSMCASRVGGAMVHVCIPWGGAMVHVCIPCRWCYGPCVYPVWVVLWSMRVSRVGCTMVHACMVYDQQTVCKRCHNYQNSCQLQCQVSPIS